MPGKVIPCQAGTTANDMASVMDAIKSRFQGFDLYTGVRPEQVKSLQDKPIGKLTAGLS